MKSHEICLGCWEIGDVVIYRCHKCIEKGILNDEVMGLLATWNGIDR